MGRDWCLTFCIARKVHRSGSSGLEVLTHNQSIPWVAGPAPFPALAVRGFDILSFLRPAISDIMRKGRRCGQVMTFGFGLSTFCQIVLPAGAILSGAAGAPGKTVMGSVSNGRTDVIF